MTNFSKLNFAAELPNAPVDKTAERKLKLVANLQNQIALLADPKMTVKRDKWVENEDGEKVKIVEDRPLKSWVKVVEGKAFVQCRVGTRPIMFDKESKYIVCGECPGAAGTHGRSPDRCC